MIKKTVYWIGLLCLSFFLVACQDDKSKAVMPVMKVGTIAGPETQLMEVAKKVALEKYNLNIDIVPFTDYNQPNQALDNRSIDANVFQHLPYLTQSIAAYGYEITPIGKTFIYPMGIYSKRYDNLAEVPANGIVAIPNDPSNQGRALLLLQAAGLITLKEGGNPDSTPMDILSNPGKLRIKSMDAAQLPRVLPDVALALINTNYAIVAGLLPTRDALFTEDKTSPYANLIVVRTNEANTANSQHLVDALHSTEVLQAAQTLFSSQAIPAW